MIEHITSHQNPRVKKAIRLHSSRGRQSQGRIIVFGMREVERAVRAGVEFEEIFFADSEADAALDAIESITSANTTRLFRLDDNVFAKVAFGDRIEGVIGMAIRPDTRLENVELDQANSKLVIVLQSLEKPGNIGAILRTADAVGAAAVICADPLTDVFHPNSIRSSTGTLFSIPLATGSSEQVQAWLRENKFRVHTAYLENANSFFQSDLTGNVAIVLGSEANGLDDRWKQTDFIAVKLPMRGQADSLNVSATAAVMMYESMRQRESLK